MRHGKKTFFPRGFVLYAELAAILYFGLSAFFPITIHEPLYVENPYFYWDCCYLTLPVGLLSYAISRKYNAVTAPQSRPFLVWVRTLFLTFFIVLFFFPYQMAANALGAPKIPVTIQGVITKKHILGGKSTSYVLDIEDQTLRREFSFAVSHPSYESLSVGQTYHEKLLLGRFGIPYRWIWQRL